MNTNPNSSLPSSLWAPIAGYEGLYEIASSGAVRNSRTGQILSQFVTSKGYAICKLQKNGRGQNFKVHRLVAYAFVPKPKGCNQVNHIDLVKLHNSAGNLEWVTQAENNRHFRDAAKAGQVSGNIISTERCVEIQKAYREAGVSQRQFALRLGMPTSTLWDVLRRDTAGGVRASASPRVAS